MDLWRTLLLVSLVACGDSEVATGGAGGNGSGSTSTGEGASVQGGAVAGGAGGEANGGGGVGAGGMGGSGGVTLTPWSDPVSLVDDLGRLAIANRVHLVGHSGGQLVHRSSTDDGATWGAPTVISNGSGNFPAMYGGLFAQGDDVYLLTADADMDSSASVGGRQLDFRHSADNGATWQPPVRITTAGTPIFRARIVASNGYVHVAGTSNPTTNASSVYFRSTNQGATWVPGVALAANLGTYGGGQTVAVDGATVHVAYTLVESGVGSGPTMYLRSTDNGASWSQPVEIGESSAESDRQARVQLSAADGRVFACWQREGSPLPADRIGYNRSLDGGQTWGVAQVLPNDTGVDRNHQHVWMASGGGVHILWRHGDSGDATPDPAGYIHSPDYGATWGPSVMAVDTAATLGANHPWNIVADADAVHVLTGPDGAMQYAVRLLGQ